MGSAKEPETLQFLKQEAVPEDAHQPSSSSSSPCNPEKGRCLKSIQCDEGHPAMRNCCINDLATKESSQDNTMVDNPNPKEKAPAADPKPSMDRAGTTDTMALKDTNAGGTPLEVEEEKPASHDLCHNSQHGLNLTEPSGSPTNTCNPLETKVTAVIEETKVTSVAGETGKNLPAESCLKGANKDSASTPSSSKHVAFLEPSKNKDEAESSRVGTGHSEAGLVLPTCLRNTSQGQLCASSENTPDFNRDICGKVENFNEGHRDPSALGATKESGTESISGKSGKPVTESQSGEISSVALDIKTSGDSSIALEVPTAIISHDVQSQGLTAGELQAPPSQATKETEGLREAVPADAKSKSQDQEQQRLEVDSMAAHEGHTPAVEMRHAELLNKTCSLEVTPSQHDAGTQADNRVSLVSVAISPINPPDGSTAFTFHAKSLGGPSLMSPGPEQKPTKKDVEMQVSIPVETRSVATGPMTPITKSPQASYPEVHVKGAQEETPEPVREVSWDEKGMTWEVYGASMEVEVLGMAIQKHLEKQIEEHGRQTVMTPQSTRSSSIKGPPHKGEIKRQPSVFRALLQNVRRPHCCSRGGPAVE